MSNVMFKTRRDTARTLGIHLNTLDNYRKRNQGPPYIRLGSRLIRYPVQALLDWQQSQQQH